MPVKEHRLWWDFSQVKAKTFLASTITNKQNRPQLKTHKNSSTFCGECRDKWCLALRNMHYFVDNEMPRSASEKWRPRRYKKRSRSSSSRFSTPKPPPQPRRQVTTQLLPSIAFNRHHGQVRSQAFRNPTPGSRHIQEGPLQHDAPPLVHSQGR